MLPLIYHKILLIDKDGVIEEAFTEISAYHKENHDSQLPLLRDYFLKTHNKEIKHLEEILYLQEKLFFTIDDSIDKAFLNNKKLFYYNEVVKFVSTLLLNDFVFQQQLKDKKNLLQNFLGQPLLAQQYIDSIFENVSDLILIPKNEKILKELLQNPTIEHIIANQINRTKHIDIYLSSLESFLKIKINKKDFNYLRAMQLIRKDYLDIEKDNRTGSNNIFHILKPKSIPLLKEASKLLLDSIQDSYLKQIAQKEYSQILSFLP